MKRLIGLVVIIVMMFALKSCYYDKAELVYPNTTCDTTIVAYTTHIQQIINNNCQGCHTGSSPSSGFQLGNYNALRSKALDNNKLINRLTSTSQPMPPTGNLPACEINKIRAWINKGFPN